MAQTLNEVYPNVIRFTLGGIDELTRVNLPENAKRVSVQFITNAGKLALVGTDGGVIGSNYMTIAADIWFEISTSIFDRKNTSTQFIFLASGTSSTVVEVVVEA